MVRLSLGTRVLSDEELIGHCLEGNAVNLSEAKLKCIVICVAWFQNNK